MKAKIKLPSRNHKIRGDRALTLTPLERKEIARRAACVRWGKSARKRVSNSNHPYSALEPEDAVLVAAAKVFAARGYEDPTLNEIAAAAGVGLQTIYRFFPAKRTLYLRVCRRLHERQMAYYSDLIRLNGTHAEKLYGLALGISYTHAQPHLIRLQHWKLLDPESHLLEGPAADHWNHHYDEYIDTVAQMGVADPERHVISLIGSIVGMAQYITVMGSMHLVQKLLRDPEGVALFCLQNVFSDIDWQVIRPRVQFNDFDLEWIGGKRRSSRP